MQAADPSLPPELAVLRRTGFPLQRLLAVAAQAERLGVTGEAVLLSQGFADTDYYRFVASALRVGFILGPVPLTIERGSSASALESGIARLGENWRGADLLLAPRGESLRRLLRDFAAASRRGPVAVPRRFLITTPRHLAALLRAADAETLADRAGYALARRAPDLSARTTVTGGQRRAARVAAGLLAVGFAVAPQLTSEVLLLALTMIFQLLIVLRTLATAVGQLPQPAVPPAAGDAGLPLYTIVVPLRGEARIVPDLVEAMLALDYPPSRLDVKFMLEADDPETIATFGTLALPAHVDVVVVPAGMPRTKPRALNCALDFARGEFLVVFDAEDRPERDQIRKAVGRFRQSAERVACLQARLAIDNADGSWISRLFALEYAILFDVVLPGFVRLGLPVPLGGTSNHFRTAALRRLAGWDPWNVTEDADIGFRLARFGLKVEMLDSTTWEEAPTAVGAWLAQRRRWMKGWVVTALVHSRHPSRLVGSLGWWGTLGGFVWLLGGLATCVLGPPLTALFAVDLATGALRVGDVWHRTIFGFGLCLAASAPLALAWPLLLALRRRGLSFTFATPVQILAYRLLMMRAAVAALKEAGRDPHRWVKTAHGLAERATPATAAADKVPAGTRTRRAAARAWTTGPGPPRTGS